MEKRLFAFLLGLLKIIDYIFGRVVFFFFLDLVNVR